jgi:1,4-dihydroxy-2-naphthoyl-CoA hydrolase
VTVEQDSEQLITETFIERSKGTLVDQMGITIVAAAPDRVVGTMPVAGNTQPYGLLHGGASCVLAETLGSLGSALHAGPDRFTVGIEISATHHRAAASGLVTGVATLLHGGRTVTTHEIVISDDRGRRVCTARLTCLLSDRVPGRSGPAAPSEGTVPPSEGTVPPSEGTVPPSEGTVPPSDGMVPATGG